MNLFASIATYDPILPSVGIPLLRNILERLILPYSRNPNINYTAQWAQINPKCSFLRPLQDVQWEQLDSKTNLEWATIVGIPKPYDMSTSEPFIDIEVSFLGNSTTPCTIEFSAYLEEILGGTIDLDVQIELVELFTLAFVEVGGDVGYITIDSVWPSFSHSTSPYESDLLLPFPRPANYFREKARGYYWGNFLGQNQVRLLGGEAELQKAPVYLAQPLKNGGFYLQLTETLNNIDASRLHQLKEFLAPILPTSSHPPVQELLKLARSQQKPDPETHAWHLAKLQEMVVGAGKPPLRLPEAQGWLEENKNPCAFAGNRFNSTAEALAFVKKLYEMGATHISIGDLWDEPWRLKKEGGPYATALEVDLPADEEKRKALFDLLEAEGMNQEELHLESPPDQTGIKTLTFWWD